MPTRTAPVPGHLAKEWLTESAASASSTRRIEGRVAFYPEHHQELLQALAAGRLPQVASAQELGRLFAPDPAVVVKLARYLEDMGLTVAPPRSGGLYLDFVGTAGRVTGALRCTFAERLVGGRRVRFNREEPELPTWAVPHVQAILGLETVAEAQPCFRPPSPTAEPANGGQGFYPQDLMTAYAFPAAADGQGETIAVLEFSNGFATSDIEAFWRRHQIPVRPIRFVSVDGTTNDGGVAAVDMECTLDLEWAGAMAPAAGLVVYEATAGTDDVGFSLSLLRALDAVAMDDVNHPTVVSISYGGAEDRFPESVLNAWDVAVMRCLARGITVLAASGDAGAYGIRGPGTLRPHVDVPAAVPHVLAVGGTTLTLTAQDQREQETGWTDTNDNGASGGGVSEVFALPAWQADAHVPLNLSGTTGRGVPDVALVANPDTGFNVIFQGASTVVGGTSGASPVWAALVARVNQKRGNGGKPRLGFVTPTLYRLGGTSVFHLITEGNNSMPGVPGYQCGPGWSAVTGWGTPDGELLAATLA